MTDKKINSLPVYENSKFMKVGYYETKFFEIMTNHNQSYARISYVFMMRGYNYKFRSWQK